MKRTSQKFAFTLCAGLLAFVMSPDAFSNSINPYVAPRTDAVPDTTAKGEVHVILPEQEKKSENPKETVAKEEAPLPNETVLERTKIVLPKGSEEAIPAKRGVVVPTQPDVAIPTPEERLAPTLPEVVIPIPEEKTVPTPPEVAVPVLEEKVPLIHDPTSKETQRSDGSKVIDETATQKGGTVVEIPSKSVVEVPTKVEVPKIIFAPSIGEILSEVTEESKKKGETLSIPEGNDLSFLDGVWRCKMGDLRNSHTKEKIQLEFTFDKNGKGWTNIKEISGTVYTAKVKAKLKNRVLDIFTTKYKNPNRANDYLAQHIRCVQDEKQKKAACYSTKNPDWQNNVEFIRVQ